MDTIQPKLASEQESVLEELIQRSFGAQNFYIPRRYRRKKGSDEPCDLIVQNYAIDTKYRLGSGDSGTLKKFKSYGHLLREQGYEPVFLFLREDNLPAAMTACRKGNWNMYIGKQSFDFIKNISGFDMEDYLTRKASAFLVVR